MVHHVGLGVHEVLHQKVQVLRRLQIKHHFVGVRKGDALLPAEVKECPELLALFPLLLGSLLRIRGAHVLDQRVGRVVRKDHLAVQLLVGELLLAQVVVGYSDVVGWLGIGLSDARLLRPVAKNLWLGRRLKRAFRA